MSAAGCGLRAPRDGVATVSVWARTKSWTVHCQIVWALRVGEGVPSHRACAQWPRNVRNVLFSRLRRTVKF